MQQLDFGVLNDIDSNLFLDIFMKIQNWNWKVLSFFYPFIQENTHYGIAEVISWSGKLEALWTYLNAVQPKHSGQNWEREKCSGYLRKETIVVSIALPFFYHFAVHLKNSSKKGINS